MFIKCASIDHAQINDLSQVPVPVMLLPDDFKASTKIKVNNHFFNKYCAPLSTLLPVICTDFYDLFACMCLSEMADPPPPLENNNAFSYPNNALKAAAITTNSNRETSLKDERSNHVACLDDDLQYATLSVEALRMILIPELEMQHHFPSQ